MSEENFEQYVGKVLGKDLTVEELGAAFPQYRIAVYKPTTITLAVAGFKPDRLRVWLDPDNKITRMVTG